MNKTFAPQASSYTTLISSLWQLHQKGFPQKGFPDVNIHMYA